MTALPEHLHSLNFPPYPRYGWQQIQRVQNKVLAMVVQVCRIQEPAGLIHQITAQLESMKTISWGRPMARGERILKFLNANDINAPSEPTDQALATWAEKSSVSKSERLAEFLSRLQTAFKLVPLVVNKMIGLKEHKVLRTGYSFEHDGAAMVLKKTVRHWRKDLAWRFHDLYVHQRGIGFLQKNRQG